MQMVRMIPLVLGALALATAPARADDMRGGSRSFAAAAFANATQELASVLAQSAPGTQLATDASTLYDMANFLLQEGTSLNSYSPDECNTALDSVNDAFDVVKSEISRLDSSCGYFQRAGAAWFAVEQSYMALRASMLAPQGPAGPMGPGGGVHRPWPWQHGGQGDGRGDGRGPGGWGDGRGDGHGPGGWGDGRGDGHDHGGGDPRPH